MTKKMLKRIVAIMIAACMCLEVFAVQAAESDVFTEDAESIAVETEEVSVSEQAEPELPVLEVMPEELPELSGEGSEEVTEPEVPETEPAEEPDLPVEEEQPDLPVVEVLPEDLPEILPEVPETEPAEEPEEQPELSEEEISEPEVPETEPAEEPVTGEEVQPATESEEEVTAEEPEEETAETEPATEEEEELAALNETDDKLTDFSVAAIEITEYTNGWWESYWGDNDEYIEHAYYYYNVCFDDGPSAYCDLEYSIEYDGESYTGNREDIYEITGEYPYIGPSDQSYENQWTAEHTYTIEVTLLGKTAELEITIQPSPLTSIEAASIEIIENTHGYWEGHEDENGQLVQDYFYYSDLMDVLQYTIVYNGETISGDCYTIYNETGEFPNISLDDQYEEHWAAGQTYHGTAELMGKSCAFDITILPSPLTFFEAQPIQIIEKTQGYWVSGGPTGEFYYYRTYGFVNEILFNIVYDGQSYSGTASDLASVVGEYVNVSDFSNQDEEHWTVGNTYHATASLMGKTCDVAIKIVPSSLTGFSAEPVSVIEGTMGNVVRDSGGNSWFSYNVMQMPVEFTVTSPEEEFTGTPQELYEHFGYSISLKPDNQSQNHWTVNNTYTVECSFMGKDAEIEISILPSPVTSFIVNDIEIVENTNGYYLNYPLGPGQYSEIFTYSFDLNTINCEVTYNGSYSGSLAGLEEEYGYTAIVSAVQAPPNQWTVGNTYTATAWFMGKTCDFNVTIVEDQTDWEIEDGTLYIHQGADMQNWVPKSVPWFTDRESITRAVIEDGVKKIGSNAFNGCTNLTEVVVPDSVASIGANAFLGCTSLTAISIPDQVRYIDQSAFNGCTQLATISLPDSVTRIVYYAFQNCTSLESIDLPVSVKAINSGAFYGCDNLMDVNYGGTESDRNQMVIGGNNEPLLSATWHYLEASGIYSLNTHEIITCVGYPKELYFMGEDEADRLEGMWESSDSMVAYYDEERGCVVAERPGEATISFTSLDGEYSDECAVAVYGGLDHGNLIFRLGTNDDPVQLLFLDPYGAAVEGTWSCDDPDVATVSESGLVTPVGVGTTTVYFEFEAGDLAAECEISVIAPRYELNYQTFHIPAERARVCFYFEGDHGQEADGTWVSSNPEVAVIEKEPENDFATIRGISIGTTTITYTTSDGAHTDTCDVTVIRGLNYHAVTLLQGGEGLQLNYEGVNGVEMNAVRWENNTPSVVSVSQGYVTPLSEGTAQVVFIGRNPNDDIDYCTVTVIDGQISYEWDEEQCTCTAKLTRSVDQAVVETETVTAAVDVTGAVSCDRDGEMLLTAVFTKPVFGTQTKTVIIPSLGHRLTKTDAVEATYESEGNIEYWTCGICGRHFSDEAGTNEISQEDTVTPKLVLTGWQQIDGKWYYYNADGVALTGWQKIGSKWYYLGTDGVMKTGWVKVSKSWYYMNSSGVMQTGWKKVSGKWYYLGTNGVMRTGWQEVSGSWYYLGTDGVMRTGWQEVSGSWYYLGTDGIRTTGWQKVDEKWYYLGTDGVRTTGWQKISKKWYYMGTDGVMATGWKKISKKWYYFGTDGVMCTGWKKISSKWYYFNSSGVMVTGTQTIDGKSYTFGSDGVWTGK